MTAAACSSLAGQLSGWTPPATTFTDVLDPAPAEALHQLVTSAPRPTGAGTLRPLDHWIYFREWTPPPLLGADGHPASGDHLPPLTDRRRMFAGGRCSYLYPLTFASAATAENSVTRTDVKRGRSGDFVLVTVQTRISQRGQLCVVEEQDLMYRSGPTSAPPKDRAGKTTPTDVDVSGAAASGLYRRFDQVELFQFSALTKNSHRIHYDLPYAQAVEGYPGLLVQGPLLVMVLAAMLDDQQVSSLTSLAYTLRRPVYAGDPVRCLPAQEESATATGRQLTWELMGAAGGRRASLTVDLREPSVAVR